MSSKKPAPNGGKPKGNPNFWQSDYDYLHKLNNHDRAWIENFEKTYSLGYANDDILTPEQRKDRNHSLYVDSTGKPLLTFDGFLKDERVSESMEGLDPEFLVMCKLDGEKAKAEKLKQQRALNRERQKRFKLNNAKKASELPKSNDATQDSTNAKKA